jgi:cell division septal protein FtsQ
MFFKNKHKSNKICRLDVKRNFRQKRNTSASNFSLGRFLFYFLGLIFVGTIVYFLFFSEYLSVNVIEIEGTEMVNAKEIESTITEKISGKFLGIIPKNNLLFIGKKGTVKYLLNKFNRLENVQIERIFPEKIKIRVEEKKFVLVFITGDRSYLIDEKGVAWPKNNFEISKAEEENLAKLTDESGKTIADEKTAIEIEFIKYIQATKDGIENEVGLEINNNFFTPYMISGDLDVETKDGWEIRLNREINLEKSLKILKSVLGNEIKKEDIPNLEYLDLRINNKVYYKLKNSENATEDKTNGEQKNEKIS